MAYNVTFTRCFMVAGIAHAAVLMFLNISPGPQSSSLASFAAAQSRPSPLEVTCESSFEIPLPDDSREIELCAIPPLPAAATEPVTTVFDMPLRFSESAPVVEAATFVPDKPPPLRHPSAPNESVLRLESPSPRPCEQSVLLRRAGSKPSHTDVQTPASQGPAHVTPAALIEYTRPDYPAAARRARSQGTVTLEIAVLVSGGAGDVRVAASSGFAELDVAAIEAVRDWRFSPAASGGVPVESIVEIPVRFVLEE